MVDFGTDFIHPLVVILLAVMRLVVARWQQRKSRREIQELRRLLQEETEKRELLQNQVHLLWDKVHRNR